MVKALVLIFALVLTVDLLEAGNMTLEEAKEIMIKTGKKCANETEAPQEDIEKLKQHELPETHAGKCMAACMYKEFGIIKDGKYTVEGVIKATESLYEEGSEELEKVKSIAETCVKQIGDSIEDECELAVKALACEIPLIKAAGIPVPI